MSIDGSDLAALALGYVLGSIPFGVVFTRAAGLGDIRAIGSGNIGATNVLRTGRRGLAAATLLGDGLKGTAAVLLAQWLIGGNTAVLAGFAALLGHIFPLWLGFRGGKGVATYLGVLAGLDWRAAVAFAAIWLAVAAATRTSSLGALIASLAVPFVVFFLDGGLLGPLFLFMSAILWLRHEENIRRLVAGREGRIGAS
jgi:glycerol-3-phosphate acyltransferase PlsY